MHIDRSCQFCHSDLETTDHIFMTCPFSQQIWDAFLRSYSPLHWNNSFINWLDSFRIYKDPSSHTTLANVLILCYQIWYARNSTIFRQVNKTPTQVGYAAATMALQYQNANPSPHIKRKAYQHLIKWQPPDSTFVKL